MDRYIATDRKLSLGPKSADLSSRKATFDLVCDCGEFDWEERGSVDVKGKGEMRTYFLREADGGDEELW